MECWPVEEMIVHWKRGEGDTRQHHLPLSRCGFPCLELIEYVATQISKSNLSLSCSGSQGSSNQGISEGESLWGLWEKEKSFCTSYCSLNGIFLKGDDVMRPNSIHITLFKNKVLGDGKMRLLEWVLTPNDCILLRKRGFMHRSGLHRGASCTVQRGSHV